MRLYKQTNWRSKTLLIKERAVKQQWLENICLPTLFIGVKRVTLVDYKKIWKNWYIFFRFPFVGERKKKSKWNFAAINLTLLNWRNFTHFYFKMPLYCEKYFENIINCIHILHSFLFLFSCYLRFTPFLCCCILVFPLFRFYFWLFINMICFILFFVS